MGGASVVYPSLQEPIHPSFGLRPDRDETKYRPGEETLLGSRLSRQVSFLVWGRGGWWWMDVFVLFGEGGGCGMDVMEFFARDIFDSWRSFQNNKNTENYQDF